jgi:hypothetical protein
MTSKLVLAGKSKMEIVEWPHQHPKKELPPLEPGAMCYVISKQQ